MNRPKGIAGPKQDEDLRRNPGIGNRKGRSRLARIRQSSKVKILSRATSRTIRMRSGA